MKNIGKLIITILIITALLSISIFAVNVDNVSHNHEITIEFQNSSLSELEQEQFIGYLETGEQAAEAGNLLCTLFGHSMEDAGIIVATYHNYYSTAPKCKIETHAIAECTRCGYVTSDLIGSCSSSCCP